MYIAEKPASPRLTGGDNPSVERQYTVWPCDNEETVRFFALANSPIFDLTTGLALVRKRPSLSKQDKASDVWDVTIPYERAAVPEIGFMRWTCDTTGGQSKITSSIKTVGSYAPPGKTAPDFKGLIGVKSDGTAEGVEIQLPSLVFTETWRLPAACVGQAYIRSLALKSAHVNSDWWRGFAPGELKFEGATGGGEAQDQGGSGVGSGSGQNPELTFKFSAMPNVTSLAVGDITGIAKKGWEYLWVYYKEVKIDGPPAMTIPRPRAVYVEQVYYEAVFATLGIG
jgi:hypothetical protein